MRKFLVTSVIAVGLALGATGTAQAATPLAVNNVSFTVKPGATTAVFVPCPDKTRSVSASGHTDRGKITVKANAKNLPKGATLTVTNTSSTKVANVTGKVTCNG